MIACRYIRFFYRYVEFFLLFLLYFIRILDITISYINILNCLDSLTFVKGFIELNISQGNEY